MGNLRYNGVMQVSVDDVMNFHILRTQCHVNTVNYFAKLLGVQFPLHDSDKYSEPCSSAYAYINYALHHPDCVLRPEQIDAFRAAQIEHHRLQPHHFEHYSDATQIPPLCISEMVCDWHSANFEQNNIVHKSEFPTIMDFYTRRVIPRNLTRQQTAQIMQHFETIKSAFNPSDVMSIWADINK